MSAEKIAALNDSLRTSFEWGKVVMTEGVANAREAVKMQVLAAVQAFDAFTPDNDPYWEHDFWSVEVDGDKFFWKVDYYNQSMTMGSEDPADPSVTQRVMTIMRAEEY